MGRKCQGHTGIPVGSLNSRDSRIDVQAAAFRIGRTEADNKEGVDVLPVGELRIFIGPYANGCSLAQGRRRVLDGRMQPIRRLGRHTRIGTTAGDPHNRT